MNNASCPDWLKQIFDQLYHEQAKQVAKQSKIATLNQKQSQLEEKLKGELAFSQFQDVLDWEEVMNQRYTVENEQMYFAGIQTGMRLLQELQKFIAADTD